MNKQSKGKKGKAAPLRVPCPGCGNMRDADDAHEYECPRCGKVGFDCCVPGCNTLCWKCDEGDEE